MTAESPTITVLVVDDHPVVREGVSSQLSTCEGIALVGEASSGNDAIRVCSYDRPDIVLLDLRLPDMPAVEVVRRVIAISPASKIILFTAFPEHAGVAPALEAGARGLLVKDISGAELCAALREVAATGSLTISPNYELKSAAVITPREYDMIRLVAAGHTNAEIGHALNLSINTVKDYLGNVMHKLAARNRAQLISNARTRGLL